MVSVAIETGVEIGPETIAVQQHLRKVPSPYRRDAATSRATTLKRVLDTLIPRPHAGERTLATAFETGDETDIETETKTISETANLTVCRNTRGIITAREKRTTAGRARNVSVALHHSLLRQESAREAGAVLGATLTRRSLGVPGVLGERKTFLGKPNSPQTRSFLDPIVIARHRQKASDHPRGATDRRRLEIQGDQLGQGVQVAEPGRVLGVDSDRHPGVETLLRILQTGPTRGVVASRRYQTRIIHRHRAVQVLDPGAAFRQLHLIYQAGDAPLQTLIHAALPDPAVETPKPTDGKARALQTHPPDSIQRLVPTASR